MWLWGARAYSAKIIFEKAHLWTGTNLVGLAGNVALRSPRLFDQSQLKGDALLWTGTDLVGLTGNVALRSPRLFGQNLVPRRRTSTGWN
jgi:hypothetical protein